MKRYGNLYPQITDFANLLLAANKAQKGKRFRQNVLEFNFHIEHELFQLQSELTTHTYQPGEYRTFEIFEPKRRLISAAPYRDRVVHHALCHIIVPLFEAAFISDSYANRVGFGTHRALQKFTKFSRSSRYILLCDIRQYFPSIDHLILKDLLRKKIKCPDTLWLLDTIIDNSNEQFPVIDFFPRDDLLTPLQRRRGLPIGNLTSQFFANVYLNHFDHFIKQQLSVKKYIRYVDDFALFADDRNLLIHARPEIETYLGSQLRLKIHPIKSQIFETSYGANFLGFRIFSEHIRVRSYNLKRGKRRLKQLSIDYQNGKITKQQIQQSVQSWIAHLKQGDTWQLRQKIFQDINLKQFI
jgi:RNA-directed DNA polymerase